MCWRICFRESVLWPAKKRLSGGSGVRRPRKSSVTAAMASYPPSRLYRLACWAQTAVTDVTARIRAKTATAVFFLMLLGSPGRDEIPYGESTIHDGDWIVKWG